MPEKHVVFVTGDHEYGGEETMPPLAAELERNYDLKTTVLKSYPDQNAEENIPGLEALDTADLAIFFLRWRRLPEDQVKHIEDCMKRGTALMGFRTTSHSFKYPDDHPLVHWNAWAAEAFGAPPGWGNGHTHYGHDSSTDVSIMDEGKDHPVMTGVDGPFHCRSWVYHVTPMSPPADATPLLLGHPVNPRTEDAEDNPVAWVWQNQHGGRVFFTTLGHPEDFKEEPVVRLVVNAIHWCLDLPVPDPWKGMFKMDAPYQGMRK